jgi:hypothetical protein
MSGQGKYRSIWEKYYDESEVMILVKLIVMVLGCDICGRRCRQAEDLSCKK